MEWVDEFLSKMLEWTGLNWVIPLRSTVMTTRAHAVLKMRKRNCTEVERVDRVGKQQQILGRGEEAKHCLAELPAEL